MNLLFGRSLHVIIAGPGVGRNEAKCLLQECGSFLGRCPIASNPLRPALKESLGLKCTVKGLLPPTATEPAGWLMIAKSPEFGLPIDSLRSKAGGTSVRNRAGLALSVRLAPTLAISSSV